MKRMVWMLTVVVVFIAATAFMVAAEEAKKDIPLYDGMAGTKIGDVCVNPTDGAEMVWVPAGEFTMGSTDEETAAALKEWPKSLQEFANFLFDAEKPQRRVHLEGYWMYKYEVTVAQYREFCKATSREMPKAPEWGWKDAQPMVMVTWQDAVDYAQWAGVSLPTEAQWEKAARGTDGRIYPWGNKWNASKCANSVATTLKNTRTVGSFASGVSPYGCMDMAGNVLEWCADWFDPNYYKNAPTRNPRGPSAATEFTRPFLVNSQGARVLRGGSWCLGVNAYFRCAQRMDESGPTNRHNTHGFRCAGTW